MPIITEDKQDPLKMEIGKKLRELQEESPASLASYISQLSEREAEEILYDGEIWLRPESQWIDLAHPATINFFCAGRSSGKTFALAHTVKRAVAKGVTDILIMTVTSRDARATVVPMIQDVYSPNDPNRPHYSPGKAMMEWPNGATALFIPAEAGKDAARGLNNQMIFFDELAFYADGVDLFTQAMLTLRREPAKCLITTTPYATPICLDLIKRAEKGDESIKMYRGSTLDNASNLPDSFKRDVVAQLEGNDKMYRQEILGELVLANDEALFTPKMIDMNTIYPTDLPILTEIAIGVDPALISKGGSKGKRSPDRVGITAAGMGDNGTIYTLEGHTKSYGSAEDWARVVGQVFDKYSSMYPTKIVIEVNAIGDEMIKMVFKQAGREDLIKYIKPVFSTQSKLQRVTPYSVMCSQGKLKFVDGDYMDLLSTELTTYTGVGKSPDAMDSAGFAWSHLRPANRRVSVISEFLV